jgi:hypothetical protein
MDHAPQYYDIPASPLVAVFYTTLVGLFLVGVCLLVAGLRGTKPRAAQIITGAVAIVGIPFCGLLLLAPVTVPEIGAPSGSQLVVTCEAAMDAAREVPLQPPFTGVYKACQDAGRRRVAEVGAVVVIITVALVGSSVARRRFRIADTDPLVFELP